jgi:5'-3' exoribonuclease 2
MNGIVHACFHPEGDTPPSENEMLTVIGKYIDRLSNIVCLRELLFLAIGGIAPRAKMISSAPSAIARRRTLHITDSNVIAPGTLFMAKVAEYVREFIAQKRASMPVWSSVSVLFRTHQSRV